MLFSMWMLMMSFHYDDDTSEYLHAWAHVKKFNRTLYIRSLDDEEGKERPDLLEIAVVILSYYDGIESHSVERIKEIT